MSGISETQMRVWSDFYRILDATYRLFKSDDEGHGTTAGAAAMRNYAGRLIEAMQGKYPICWYNLGFNPEILYAMDIAGVCIQQLGAFYSITQDLKSVIDLIDYAEALGIPSDTCSADKLSTAVIRQKLYPRPVCHVAINAPCDSQVLASQKMLELEPAPFFVIDIPYYKDTGEKNLPISLS